MIVFSHYDGKYLPESIGGSALHDQAWIFVEFFFVLSGFVICMRYSTMKSIRDFWVFVKKRFFRLYPLLLLTTLLFLGAELITGYFLDSFQSKSEPIGTLLLRTTDTLLFTNSTPILSNSMGMNESSWSISAEMICYLCFGLVTILYKGPYRMFILLSGIILSFFLKYVSFEPVYLEYNLMFLRGLCSFPLGCLLYVINKRDFKFYSGLELIVPILIFLAMYSIHTNRGFLTEVLFLNFVFFISILILLKSNGYVTKFLNTPYIQKLGRLSYSIYLNHLLMVIIGSKMVVYLFGLENGSYMHVVFLIIIGFLVIEYSSYTYNYIEKGIGRFLNKTFIQQKKNP